MSPEIPPLGRLRPATIRDVPRITTVATAGLYYSGNFAWERPRHAEYPDDTRDGFAKKFADYIRDPGFVTLVVEDGYEVDENEKTGAILREDLRYTPGARVIVGVGTWKLEDGSVRKGQFQDQEDAADPEGRRYDGGLGRDANPSHCAMLFEKYGSTAEKYFKGCAGVFIVVVHPAYWRRGHGATLMRWGLALAELDGVDQGIFGSTMGKRLYLSLGFVEVGVLKLRDEEDPHDTVELAVLRYATKGKRSHT